MQEAGRAGRDPALNADCYVLYNDKDLDKHFILHNQSKLTMNEIQSVWRAIKDLTKNRPTICCSALEIARQAGWNETPQTEIETRVKTALSALETSGYIVRGRNVPRVYATSIQAKNMIEASNKIRTSSLFTDEKKQQTALRIIQFLLSSRSRANTDADAESRVDYIADKLAITKSDVIESITFMRQEGLLDDFNDMSAYIFDGDTKHKSTLVLERFAKLEAFLIDKFSQDETTFSFKELNEEAQDSGITTSNIKNIKTILYFLAIKNYISKQENKENCTVSIGSSLSNSIIKEKFEKRIDICRFILNSLFAKNESKGKDKIAVEFSVVNMFKQYKSQIIMELFNTPVILKDIEDAFLYLSKIGAVKLEGGFLVIYAGMEIRRLIMDNRIQYKVEDYKMLDDFYKQKIQQIHIVGEYANLMVKDFRAALQFVQDYFNIDFKKFISKYFKGDRSKEIERNITPAKYKELFGDLSEKQSAIINDANSKYIVVAAGPGSGKTKVLVHKLASLLLLEDVKHEQLLMVTFSRAAATEFKKRLIKLIGNAANFVEIKTFHSYCFDLLGKIGSLEASENVVKDAAEMIRNGEVEQGKITKSVLVIDEAQDMDEDDFLLIKALMSINEDMRVIAVGDDDQNIYEFRGSNSDYMKELITYYGATKYEMTDNFRSNKHIVEFANRFVCKISNRLKKSEAHSICEDNGLLRLTTYTSSNIELDVVKTLISDNLPGKTCILANKNDECLCLLGVLLKHGIRTKLIQSLEGFRLYNLIEIREFCDSIFNGNDTPTPIPIILNEVWNKAKENLKAKFKQSENLENVLTLIKDFETTHSVKYASDFKEFIDESKYEDFYNDKENGVVYVSTIHKSKGREFDNVYMMIKDSNIESNAELRKLY